PLSTRFPYTTLFRSLLSKIVKRNSCSRRALFRRGGLFTAAMAFPGTARPTTGDSAAMKTGTAAEGARLYESIGVRPLINARGTLDRKSTRLNSSHLV